MPGKVFLAMLKQAGFAAAEMVAETGFNSSSATRGALFRASKPPAAAPCKPVKAEPVAPGPPPT